MLRKVMPPPSGPVSPLAAVFLAVIEHHNRKVKCDREECRHFGESRQDNVAVPLEGEAYPVQGKRRGRTKFMRFAELEALPGGKLSQNVRKRRAR